MDSGVVFARGIGITSDGGEYAIKVLVYDGEVIASGTVKELRQAVKPYSSLTRVKLANALKKVRDNISLSKAAGIARIQRYGYLWQKASLNKAINRHAGVKATTWVSKSGKTIYENPLTGRQVVVDPAGYFRVFQPKSFGSTKGIYLNLLGKVPSPAKQIKGGGIKNFPLTGSDLNMATHFLIK